MLLCFRWVSNRWFVGFFPFNWRFHIWQKQWHGAEFRETMIGPFVITFGPPIRPEINAKWR
jgi:hypothetical protein